MRDGLFIKRPPKLSMFYPFSPFNFYNSPERQEESPVPSREAADLVREIPHPLSSGRSVGTSEPWAGSGSPPNQGLDTASHEPFKGLWITGVLSVRGPRDPDRIAQLQP